MNLTDARDTIVKEITIKGSAERIFEAHPDQRMKWWSAEGRFQTTHMEFDLRPGGRWAMRGIGIGGKPFSVLGTYRTIERPHLLVFTWLPDWHEGAAESVVRRSGRKGRRHDTASDAFRPNERGRARASRLATDSDVAASIRGGPPPPARLTLHLGFVSGCRRPRRRLRRIVLAARRRAQGRLTRARIESLSRAFPRIAGFSYQT